MARSNAAAVATANTFDYRKSLTTLAFLTGLSPSLAIPATSLLAEAFGWRNALLWIASVQFVLSFCLGCFSLRATSPGHTRSRARNTDAVPVSPLQRAICRPVFWGLVAAFAFHWFVQFSISVHLLPMLIEFNLSLSEAASIQAP